MQIFTILASFLWGNLKAACQFIVEKVIWPADWRKDITLSQSLESDSKICNPSAVG